MVPINRYSTAPQTLVYFRLVDQLRVSMPLGSRCKRGPPAPEVTLDAPSKYNRGECHGRHDHPDADSREPHASPPASILPTGSVALQAAVTSAPADRYPVESK